MLFRSFLQGKTIRTQLGLSCLEETGHRRRSRDRSRAGGSSSARVLRQAPDRPADALVRAMARPRTAGANSAAGRTQLIDATAIHCDPSSALNLANAKPRLRPLHLVVRETEFCGLRLAGYFRRRTRENSRIFGSQTTPRLTTRRNREGFYVPGNRVGLPGLHGGAEGIQTDGHRGLTPSGRGIRQNLSGGRFGHPSVQYDAQHLTFPLAPGSDLSRAKTTQ